MVKRDLLDGSDASGDQKGLGTARIGYLAVGVPGVGQEQMANVRAFVEADYPGAMTPGTPHPQLAGLYLSATNIRPLGKTPQGPAFKIDVTYARLDMPPAQGPGDDDPTYGRAEVSLSFVRRQAIGDTDIFGDQVKVSYQAPGWKTPDVQVASIPQDYILLQVTVSRREAITFQQLVAKGKAFTNRVNSGAWSLDPSASPRQWLLEGISANSSDRNATYNVMYTFLYDKDGHDPEVRYILREDGRPPEDLGLDGRAWPSMYDEANFDGLQIPLPSV